jgi:hypothetical protein
MRLVLVPTVLGLGLRVGLTAILSSALSLTALPQWQCLPLLKARPGLGLPFPHNLNRPWISEDLELLAAASVAPRRAE